MNAERIPQSVALRVPFKAFLSSDHVTPGTGLTIAVEISKNMAAFDDPDAGATNATEVEGGWYYVDLDTADIDTLGPLVVRGTEGTIDPAEVVYRVVNPNNAGFAGVPDAAADGAGGLPISDAGGLDLDVVGAAAVVAGAVGVKLDDTLEDDGGTYRFTANALEQAPGGAGVAADVNIVSISGDATAADNLEAMLDGTGGVTLSAVLGTNAITATSIAANAIGAGELAADAAVEIAAAVWDRLLTGATHNIPASAGRILRTIGLPGSFVIHSGTAQAGATTTITLDTAASTTNNAYLGTLITLTGGTGLGQTRTIVNYVGATRVATVNRPWVTTPNNTTTFAIYANTASLFSDEGTAQAGGATSITLATTASATNDLYANSFVTITSGTGSGQTRTITAYNGTTKVATVDSAWSVAPDSTSVYAVIPFGGNSSMTIAPTAAENAEALLTLDWITVSGEADRSVLNALRFLRNKWTLAVDGTLTVMEEDDATTAWTGEAGTTAGAAPVTSLTPA